MFFNRLKNFPTSTRIFSRRLSRMFFRCSSSGRITIPENMQIMLTKEEDQLCTLLDQCISHLKESQGIETSCRIAGGWVRDKLLGAHSNDIDLAFSDIMGATFAEHFVKYCSSVHNMEVGGIQTVKSNPDQSKHLETAKTNILGIDLDFVNLRSEVYADDSRIPTTVTFGTPVEDALRRDITINSLFYNVHSRLVEDHTGKGLDDLKNGIIRTPLPPKETFLDDPLRVIRCIRFASRFGFEMVPELKDSARDPEIQEAFTSKIARERVGEEIDKMMKGRDPLGSIQLITDLSLYHAIFHIPPPCVSSFSASPAPPHTALTASSLLNAFLHPSLSSSPSLPQLHPVLAAAFTHSPSTRPRLFLACALTPFLHITYVDAKNKKHLTVEAAIREGLKLGAQNHYLDGISALFSATEILGGADKLDKLTQRLEIGLLLREKSVQNEITGSYWASTILFSLTQELVPMWNSELNTFDVEEAANRVNVYNAFISRVEQYGLSAQVDAKPIIDGRQVVSVLGAKSAGAWTGRVLARVIEWQLEHPQGTKDECEAWLKAEHVAGRISMSVDPPSRGAGGKRGSDVPGNAAKKAKRVGG